MGKFSVIEMRRLIYMVSILLAVNLAGADMLINEMLANPGKELERERGGQRNGR